MAVKYSDFACQAILQGDATISLKNDTIKALLLNGNSTANSPVGYAATGGTLGATINTASISATSTANLHANMQILAGSYAITFTGGVPGYIGAITGNTSFTVVDAAGNALNVTSATNANAGLIFAPGPKNKFLSEISGLELTGITGYTGGFGGSGRKALAGVAFTLSSTGGSGCSWTATAPAWASLGALAGNPITHMGLAKEITDDAHSYYIAIYDAITLANSGTLTLNPAAGGLSVLSG